MSGRKRGRRVLNCGRREKSRTLLKDKIGETFNGVVTGITIFGIFIQIREYLIDGLIRYEDLMDDWWDVDERAGVARGQRTGTKIGIGDVKEVYITKVASEVRRELGLAIRQTAVEKGPQQAAARRRAERCGEITESGGIRIAGALEAMLDVVAAVAGGRNRSGDGDLSADVPSLQIVGIIQVCPDAIGPVRRGRGSWN